MTERLRLALIGCGGMGHRHLYGLAELERKTAENGQDDIAGWIEQPYEQTMREYFSDGVEKYAGGAAFRPTNFVSDPEIRKKLNEYYQSFVNAKL